jgi:hypothetical protein
MAGTGGGADDGEASRRSGGVNGRVLDEKTATGAVVAGRGSFEPAGGWVVTTTTACRSSPLPATPPMN